MECVNTVETSWSKLGILYFSPKEINSLFKVIIFDKFNNENYYYFFKTEGKLVIFYKSIFEFRKNALISAFNCSSLTASIISWTPLSTLPIHTPCTPPSPLCPLYPPCPCPPWTPSNIFNMTGILYMIRDSQR